jgi:hypothetical protein
VSSLARAVQSGSNVVVQVDTDGGGSANSFTDVAVLTNYGTNAADIVRVTFGGTDHILLSG